MYRLLTIVLVTLTLIGCGGAPTTTNTTARTPTKTPEPMSPMPSADSIKLDGTNAPAQLTTDQANFSDKWAVASREERRAMADLAKVYPLFNGATKAQIKSALGPATESGVDKFGDDVIRYELGAVPEIDGGGHYHLTFVFENGKVVRLLGNFATISP